MVEKSKCLSIILLPVIFFLASCNEPNTIKIPYRVDPYYWIYKPSGDTFPGPDTRELIAGKWYEEWVPNDHTINKLPRRKRTGY